MFGTIPVGDTLRYELIFLSKIGKLQIEIKVLQRMCIKKTESYLRALGIPCCFRWWEYTNGCRLNPDDDGDTTELTMEHVAGIFFILTAGVGLSIFIAMLERIYRKHRPADKVADSRKVTADALWNCFWCVPAMSLTSKIPCNAKVVSEYPNTYCWFLSCFHAIMNVDTDTDILILTKRTLTTTLTLILKLKRRQVELYQICFDYMVLII